MNTYDYRAKTPAGNLSIGNLDAADRNSAVELLRKRGLYPIEVNKISNLDKSLKFSTSKKVSLKEISIFCKQFYTMIDAGVTVIASLDMLRKQTENPKLAEITGKVFEDVQKGMSLSEAMKLHSDVFPTIVTSMMEIGEVSGNLDVVLKRLASYIEKENKVRQKIKTATVYPKVLATIAFTVIIFMMIVVVPNFVDMFSRMGAELPLPTRIILGISNLIKNIFFILGAVITIAVLSMVLKKFKKTYRGKYLISSISLKTPVVGKITQKIIASRFSRTLSLLLKTGVPLIQALEVVSNLLNNLLVAEGLAKAREEIKRGLDLAESLAAVNIFPVMVIHMISIGEESGSIDSVVEKVADFYDDELDSAIGRLLSMLEPIMIVIIAVVVGAIVISMILPIFSVYQEIN
ncbi:type II secretion system F family protein [Herbivorax sp. ANBcel31]|uniref:type II secretion system F family protein n=1 Tax=Herbivorax sp. ANBcel31 TaxID=3069754 RepID=UPI0027B6CEE8|nr:type II secretion system F family protein [Herbivorax sp. ANBcel31]MDQ2085283.1 type II secretion system F family protein [Herbivorax sp. ANBcel31]